VDKGIGSFLSTITVFPTQSPLFPKFSCKTEFSPEKSGPSGLSAGKISGFSNFEPEKIRPKKFRGKNDPAVQLSGRKFLAGKSFEPCNRKAIGRNFSGGTLPLRRETHGYEGFFRISQAIFLEFLGAKARTAQKFPA